MPTQRTTTMPAKAWAEDAQTAIPVPPIPGTAYRNEDVNVSEFGNGQRFETIVDSAKWNQLFYLMSRLLREIEKSGIPVWSTFTNYDVDSITMGTDGVLYQAVSASGPASVGAQPPPNATYWRPALEGVTFGDVPSAPIGTFNVTFAQLGNNVSASVPNYPVTLPASGGNADTLNNMSAQDIIDAVSPGAPGEGVDSIARAAAAAAQATADAALPANAEVASTSPIITTGSLAGNDLIIGITPATAATATINGDPGSVVLANDNNTTARNMAATPAGVQAQILAKSITGDINPSRVGSIFSGDVSFHNVTLGGQVQLPTGGSWRYVYTATYELSNSSNQTVQVAVTNGTTSGGSFVGGINSSGTMYNGHAVCFAVRIL